MNSQIFIEQGESLSLDTYVPIASQTMSLIAETAESINEIDETFSIADLVTLLNKISVHMAGEFEVCRTLSRYCQLVYKPYAFDEAELGENDIASDSVERADDGQNYLWIREKIVTAFTARKLRGFAMIIYFHLGYLMTRDEAFAASRNISFEKILESCDEWRVKHPTTVMRALADLQDAGLIKWNAETRTFELLYITASNRI